MSQVIETCVGCSAVTVEGAAFCGECGASLAVREGSRVVAAPRWGGRADLTRYLCAAVILAR